MRNTHFYLFCVIAALALPLGAAQLPPDAPLVVDGPVRVEAADVEGFMLRIPENLRGEVRMSYDRIATIIDNIFLSRSVAQKAREEGFDRDPLVQRRLAQVQEAALAELYLKRLERDTPAPNLEARARDLYPAHASKYVVPEQLHVQQILVNLKGRTREMALERARQIYAEGQSGKEDFVALANRYTDDADRDGTKRVDNGFVAVNGFIAPVAEAISRMKTKGEISAPIESANGYHIIRFVERKAPRQLKFEDVRAQIIAAEKQRLQKKTVEDLVENIRSSSTAVFTRENVEALVIHVDPSVLKAAAEGRQTR